MILHILIPYFQSVLKSCGLSHDFNEFNYPTTHFKLRVCCSHSLFVGLCFILVLWRLIFFVMSIAFLYLFKMLH